MATNGDREALREQEAAQIEHLGKTDQLGKDQAWAPPTQDPDPAGSSASPARTAVNKRDGQGGWRMAMMTMEMKDDNDGQPKAFSFLLFFFSSFLSFSI